MRLPRQSDLSDEQKKVYLYAPLDVPILVAGPPGTGKTVIAWHRAEAMAKMGQKKVSLVMYSRVLKQFAGPGKKSGPFGVTTMESWLREWWGDLALPASALPDCRVLLDCPKAEKDEAKALGARWDKGAYKWWVPNSTYQSDADAFSRWRPTIELPRLREEEGGVDSGRIYLDCPYAEKDLAKSLGARWDKGTGRWWVPEGAYETNPDAFKRWNPSKGTGGGAQTGYAPLDYERITVALLNTITQDGEQLAKRAPWGQLIIDEAQDFPPKLFFALRRVREWAVLLDPKSKGHFGISVFADENQRLNVGQNSSLEDIKRELNLDKRHEYLLKTNYRNTRPIAALAAHFFVGLSTGKPDLPDRKGPRPVLIRVKKRDSQVEFIERYCRSHSEKEIAVLLPSNKEREYYYRSLSDILAGVVHVQTYQSGNSEAGKAEDLRFNEGGAVTVLNMQSCKGLEFDAVFLPELQVLKASPAEADFFRMRMFVMISRAREYVALLLHNAGAEEAVIEGYLPPKELGLLEVQSVR